MGKLTNKTAQRLAKTGKKGMTGDGMGLYLQVTAGGSVSWIYRFKLQGKQRYMGLGSFPEIPLSEARELASDNRKLVKSGIDPMEASTEEAHAVEATPLFTSCAAHYIMSHRRSWRNVKHARQWVSTLKAYARPIIGSKPVDEVTTQDVLKILSPIWTTKTETAKRLQGRIENILDYAAAHGYRDPVNPARWRGHLDKLLAKPSRVKKVTHHPAMPYDEVNAFMAELKGYTSISSKALQFLILTATRTSEVLHSEWQEIGLENETWTIPADRMKARHEHRVPLSRQAMQLLKQLPRVKGNPYIFPGARPGRPLSNMAMLQLMRGMDLGLDGKRGDYVPHGFRSSFRDWTGEVTSYPRDVAEMALAHIVANKVEAAYRRGDLFEKRRAMMQEWANYIVG